MVGTIAGAIVNVDATVICEQPRLGPYKAEMERTLAEATSARVSVKATSNEGMGWIGRGEGIACIAVASVRERIGFAARWQTRLERGRRAPGRLGQSVRGQGAARGRHPRAACAPTRRRRSAPPSCAGAPRRRLGVTTAAIHYPHEIAIVDERGALSLERLHRRTNALAHSFAAMGIGPGDGVGIMCRNHRGFVEATLAAAKLGASALYLNTMFAGPQLVEVTRREGPKALVYDAEFAGLLDGRRRLGRARSSAGSTRARSPASRRSSS